MTSLLETRTLSNGLRLEVIDETRSVAADRIQVRLCFRVAIALAEAPLAEALRRHEEKPGELLQLLGPSICFEKRLERNFIDVRQHADVVDELRSSFIENAAAYLGSPDFAVRFVLRQARQARRQALHQAAAAKMNPS